MAQRIPGDLRIRIVQAYDLGQTCTHVLSRRFIVSQSTVWRIINAHKQGRSIHPAPKAGGRPKALGKRGDQIVASIVKVKSHLTCSEISEVIAKKTGKKVSAPTISRALSRQGFTKKKITSQAEEQNRPDVQKKRRQHKAQQRGLDAKRLVFLDETGINRLMGRDSAWARRNERAIGIRPVNNRSTTTVVGAIRSSGPVAMRSFRGGMKKDKFLWFITSILAPSLLPGDVLLMDNLKCHHAPEVIRAVERQKARVVFLPPYSPDLNPIEKFWSTLKGRFKQRYDRNQQSISQAMGGAWRSYLGFDMRGLVASAGYSY